MTASLLVITFYLILGWNLPLCNFLQFRLFVTEQLGGHSFQFHSVTLVGYLLLYILYLILCLIKSVFPHCFDLCNFTLLLMLLFLSLSSIGVFFLFFLLFFFFGQETGIYWWAWGRRGQHRGSHECRPAICPGATISDYLTPQPSRMSRFSDIFSNSSTWTLVNSHFLEMWIFWWPGNWTLALRRASVTCSLFCRLVWMDIMTLLVWTLATSPWVFPKAAHIPVWSLDWDQHASCDCPLERTVHWKGLSPSSLYR